MYFFFIIFKNVTKVIKDHFLQFTNPLMNWVTAVNKQNREFTTSLSKPSLQDIPL